MIAADRRGARAARLLVVDATGAAEHLPRSALGARLRRGDLVVANDAATLPASLPGTHRPTGTAVEVHLAGWLALHDPTRFVAIVFGPGDHRTPTESRPAPAPLAPGDRLTLGPLEAQVERRLDHPRLVVLRFLGRPAAIRAGLARHGRPIQYAHVPEPLKLWDVWTPLAADPVAFEPPSAGFALQWQTLAEWRDRGIGFATLTHAAGISSTGDPALDRRLPFDEPYQLPERTVEAINRTRSAGGRVVAVGTTVVRALESAAADGSLRPGGGIARGRIEAGTRLRVVDAILTGVHKPGESHFDLLRAFAGDAVLNRAARAMERHGYRTHEFGDSLLLERQPRRTPATAAGGVPAFTVL